MTVRPARAEDREAMAAILDAAMLETDPERTAAAVADGRAFVAEADGRILGAVVCVPREAGVHVDAIAVRPGRRGQGIGSALLSALTDRFERVTAAFDPGVRPFYEQQGWTVEAAPEEGDRLRAAYSTSGSTSSRPAASNSETRSSSGPSA
jgi:GNAT superfamily N-acetyltransferase